MLRVANVETEAALESVRDALDRLGIDYEHLRSEPDDDRFPRPPISTSPTTPQRR
jgi:hypothetical protein